MKRLFPAALLILSTFGCKSQPVAELKSSPPPALAEDRATKVLAGYYTGKWTGTDGTAGDLRIKLNQDGRGGWVAEPMFSFDGAEIPGKVKSFEVNGSTLRLVFDWQIQGTPGQSTISGAATGDTLQGAYETRSIAGASRGTWTVTRS